MLRYMSLPAVLRKTSIANSATDNEGKKNSPPMISRATPCGKKLGGFEAYLREARPLKNLSRPNHGKR